MKKNLANRLNERSESVEYRKIVRLLMNAAQNKQNNFRLIAIDNYSLTRLQNEGVKVERINEFGTEKYLLSW